MMSFSSKQEIEIFINDIIIVSIDTKMETKIKIIEKENTIKRIKDANLIKIKLRDSPLTVAYLKQAHTENFLKLPKKIINSASEFLNEMQEKPLIALVFGSFAKGNYTGNSDIDVLLVFQKIINQADIENTAKRIGMRTNTKITPVYVDYGQFEKNFLNKNHEFSNEIRQNVIILAGIEHYYRLLWRFLE